MRGSGIRLEKPSWLGGVGTGDEVRTEGKFLPSEGLSFTIRIWSAYTWSCNTWQQSELQHRQLALDGEFTACTALKHQKDPTLLFVYSKSHISLLGQYHEQVSQHNSCVFTRCQTVDGDRRQSVWCACDPPDNNHDKDGWWRRMEVRGGSPPSLVGVNL